MNLENLSVNEKIGQKFMFGVNSHNIDMIIDLIRDYSIGGVILYKKNYLNYDEMLDVVRRLRDANKENKIPLFIAIDQEGGKVNRMPSEFLNVKNVYDLSKDDCDKIKVAGSITGKMLSLSGINMNFAPVMDIYDGNPKNKALYKRCFYGDVDNIGECGKKYVKELTDNGVISVIKHFPGHGASHVDSHFMTPYVRNYREILDLHIKPFDEVISSLGDAVMVSHLVIKGLTERLPASISSKFINEYLRERYKFNGLVITDEINMLSHSIRYGLVYEKKAIMAGSDIILVKIKDKKNGIRIINEYKKIIDKNIEQTKLLDNSVKRIIDIKKKYKLSDDISNLGCNIDEINKEIRRINDL